MIVHQLKNVLKLLNLNATMEKKATFLMKLVLSYALENVMIEANGQK